MNERPAIAIDLDGTILEYDPPEYPELGEPLPGAADALQALRELGYRVVIHTCRLRGTPEEVGEQAALITRHLVERGVPFDELFLPGAAKPMAEWYVDDRAIAFDGDWDAAVSRVVDRDLGMMAARVASAFLAYKRLERTEPGSKNKYKITYDTDSVKYTNGHPDDGRPDSDER